MKMQRIRDLREDNDLKQTDIADYLHISQRTYSHYETDSRSMPIEVLRRLAVYYNTSMDYLAELTDEKSPTQEAKKHFQNKNTLLPIAMCFYFYASDRIYLQRTHIHQIRPLFICYQNFLLRFHQMNFHIIS